MQVWPIWMRRSSGERGDAVDPAASNFTKLRRFKVPAFRCVIRNTCCIGRTACYQALQIEVNCAPPGRLPPAAVMLHQRPARPKSISYTSSITYGMAGALHFRRAGEDTNMKTKLLALIVLAGGSLFAQSRFSVGVAIGSGPGPAYYAPAPVAIPAYRPGFVWVQGYWTRTPFGRQWVPGHWERRAYTRWNRYGYDSGYYRDGYRDGYRDRD